MAKLYHVPLSPFCRKVRLSLAEKKIECELVEERYWEKDTDFLRRNPAGRHRLGAQPLRGPPLGQRIVAMATQCLR